MKRAAALLVAATLATSLAGCGSPRPKGPPPSVINRVLTGAPGEAQPSRIVSTEIAFARAAREQGQWTAFRQFAAPGAILHTPTGPVPLDTYIAGEADPAEAVQWEPRAVAISCDGAVAVSQGRYRDPDGTVGNFVTVWERQGDGQYRYVYDVGGPDVPQPPPRKPVEDGDIVVTSIDAVLGLVASCPRGDEVPPPPAIPIGEDGKADARLSRDGTLRWRWEQRDDGTRYAAADYFYEGRWLTAFEQSLVPAGAM
ncbi:nuclear transport factor 2 family protein [Erythrobacter dokdonensis]|uniref:Lipoprotein n=1 Tax=Erythrobacter dokdonensis DSW-74 TaxID=1300349 RepID=A0A1A7BIF3_9SPHN|nr:nuclear transport factor 2 family protein [Erythrobacter dokdonensis]MEE4315844.1 nuclear transport factor 2 family protein [Erythrobacter sp.]OBV10985.1 hypothetical protein I603_1393 [Erythrobacter dokdonensis DSW-74]